MTAADVDRADVRKLAEMLRLECEKWQSYGLVVESFALALLAVLDECEKWTTDKPKGLGEAITLAIVGNIIRAAAREWLANGGELSEEE